MLPQYPNLDYAEQVTIAWYKKFSKFPDSIYIESATIDEETQEVEVHWGYVFERPFTRIRISFAEWELLSPLEKKPVAVETPTDWTGAVVRKGGSYQVVIEDLGATIVTETIYSKVRLTVFKNSLTWVHPDANDWQPEPKPEITPLQAAFLAAYWKRPGRVDSRKYL